MSLHQTYMRRALALAQEAAAAGEIPVGAVVVREGIVLGEGRNGRESTADPTAHAEIVALRAAAQAIGDWRLTGCTLYVTLEPCPMCAGAIAMARLSQVVFGAQDARMGCCGSVYDIPGDAVFGRSIPVLGGILEEECRALLQAAAKLLREAERR